VLASAAICTAFSLETYLPPSARACRPAIAASIEAPTPQRSCLRRDEDQLVLAHLDVDRLGLATDDDAIDLRPARLQSAAQLNDPRTHIGVVTDFHSSPP